MIYNIANPAVSYAFCICRTIDLIPGPSIWFISPISIIGIRSNDPIFFNAIVKIQVRELKNVFISTIFQLRYAGQVQTSMTVATDYRGMSSCQQYLRDLSFLLLPVFLQVQADDV